MMPYWLFFLLLTWTTAAYADETVIVNLASPLGPATHKAMGTFVGNTPFPPSSTVTPLKPFIHSDYAGTFAGSFHNTLTGLGYTQRLAMPNRDCYGDDPSAARPGDPGAEADYSLWRACLQAKYDANVANGATDVIYEFWNEPESSWGHGDPHFKEAWRQFTIALRDRNPNVKLSSAQMAFYDDGTYRNWVDYCTTTFYLGQTICPTYWGWHEFSTISDVSVHINQLRTYLQSKGIANPQFVFSEYSNPTQHLMPGSAMKFMAEFERNLALLGGTRACWGIVDNYPSSECYNGNLNSLLTNPNTDGGLYGQRGGWWAYRAYADLAGTMVSVTPSATVNGADGAAAVVTGQQIVAVIGREIQAPQETETVTVQFTNVNTATAFPGVTQVSVTAKRISPSGFNASSGYSTVLNNVPQTISGGTVTVVLPNFYFQEGFQVILTPVGGGGTVPPPPQGLTVQ